MIAVSVAGSLAKSVSQTDRLVDEPSWDDARLPQRGQLPSPTGRALGEPVELGKRRPVEAGVEAGDHLARLDDRQPNSRSWPGLGALQEQNPAPRIRPQQPDGAVPGPRA